MVHFCACSLHIKDVKICEFLRVREKMRVTVQTIAEYFVRTQHFIRIHEITKKSQYKLRNDTTHFPARCQWHDFERIIAQSSFRNNYWVHFWSYWGSWVLQGRSFVQGYSYIIIIEWGTAESAGPQSHCTHKTHILYDHPWIKRFCETGQIWHSLDYYYFHLHTTNERA